MKAEILHRLTISGYLSNFKQSPEWVEAFDAYKKDTGDNQVGFKCGSCYRKVLAWLKR
jgi:hypothetical protein